MSTRTTTHLAATHSIYLPLIARSPDEDVQVIHYEYDGVQRLIEARVEDGTTYSYGYDEVGNRTRSGETTTAYDAANQVIGWQYDAAGNLLSDGTTSYTYDALNRLRGVASSGGTTSYTYNGDGVLLAQVQNGVETRFVADVARALPERVGAVTGTAATWYVRGLGGEELYRDANGSVAWFLSDRLGSIRTFLSQPVQAARLLLASGEEVDPTLLEKVRQALIQTMANTQISVGRRVEAGKALGDLGDPRPGVCTLPPAMVKIDGGRFVIGNPKKQTKYDDEINDQPMTIATFELARYPITNAQYKLFIDAGGYEIDAPWWDEAVREWLRRDDEATEGLKPWQKRQYKQHPEWWNDNRFGIARPNHPVVGISWYEAVAFCCWLTGYVQDGYVYRLPTEAEWEYAARRATRRVYPWGNEEPDGERANFNRTYEGTTAVGCFPQGATTDGLHDLVGNVWEWTGSVYEPCPYDPQDGREDTSNPANKRFVMRGGGWNTLPLSLRASDRFDALPDYHTLNLGLRPARHLP